MYPQSSQLKIITGVIHTFRSTDKHHFHGSLLRRNRLFSADVEF